MAAAQAGASFAGRRVLVTGAGGFIGSHLVEALVRAGADVRAFVRYNSRNDYGCLEVADPELVSQAEVFVGDLTNVDAVRNAIADREVVFHLGALIPIPYSYRHPREFVAANVVGTLNVLEAARGSNVARIVHTSTSEIYGTPRSVPISETHPIHPQSPYAATKVGADQLALTFGLSFGSPVVVMRPFNTYGPRQSARAVIPTIVTQALTRDRVELGALAPTRDLLFVEDTVAGLMRSAEVEGIEGEVINLGTGVEVSIGELAERLLALLDRPVPVVSVSERLRPETSEVERLLADVTKARDLLGWTHRVDLDEGLRRTIEWIERYPHRYKAHLYTV